MADRLPKLLAGLAVLLGVGVVAVGLSVFVEAWQASAAWAGSGHTLRADLPSEQAPLWLDAGPMPTPEGDPTSQPLLGANIGVAKTSPRHGEGEPTALAPRGAVEPTALPTRRPGNDGGTAESRAAPRGQGDGIPSGPPQGEALPGGSSGGASPTPQASGISPQVTGVSPQAAEAAPEAPVALAAPSDVALAEADFRFFDPPEPGAHARLAVTLQNRAAAPTSPISVLLNQRWLQAYSVLGAVPAVLDDRPSGDLARRFVFPPLGPGERQTVELHLLATADEVDGPEVRVLLGEDGEVGKVQPRTVAPRPRPGPARTVTVPKLNVRAAVVPVAWEPPPFVIGQVQGSAAVSEGNTVLIGHLGGPQGDVFARLSQLRPGDTVTATSRGVEYAFVVSDIAVRPYTDISPTEPTGTPRLTLMTCTGQWSVARQDYSHRLWVVAEPAELAQQTIRANAERAAQAAREAEAAAAERAAHEAEVSTQATQTAVASAPAQVPTPQSAADPIPGASQPPVVGGAPARSADGSPVGAASAGAEAAEPRAPGILIDAPSDGERVPERLTLRGRRTPEADQTAPLWLFVRAEVEGSKWYALPRSLEILADGRWQAELVLGGAAGIRHEVRVGSVTPEADAELRRHIAERPGQPLDTLPDGFMTGARLVVERR